MKKYLFQYWYVFLLAFMGIAGGFLYWRYVGCKSGTCPITSNWYSSSLIGGVMGFLVGDIFTDIRKKRKNSGKPNQAD